MNTAGQAVRENRPLETIALAANRVNSATVGVQQFLNRFHGEAAEAEVSDKAPDPQHHAAALDRLFSALDRLESRVEALNSIG